VILPNKRLFKGIMKSLKNLLMNGKNINHSKILWLFLLMFMKGGSFLIQPIKIKKGNEK